MYLAKYIPSYNAVPCNDLSLFSFLLTFQETPVSPLIHRKLQYGSRFGHLSFFSNPFQRSSDIFNSLPRNCESLVHLFSVFLLIQHRSSVLCLSLGKLSTMSAFIPSVLSLDQNLSQQPVSGMCGLYSVGNCPALSKTFTMSMGTLSE